MAEIPLDYLSDRVVVCRYHNALFRSWSVPTRVLNEDKNKGAILEIKAAATPQLGAQTSSKLRVPGVKSRRFWRPNRKYGFISCAIPQRRLPMRSINSLAAIIATVFFVAAAVA